jgi:hypothetical protein
MRIQAILLVALLLLLPGYARCIAAENAVTFNQSTDNVEIVVAGRPLATYYFRDAKTLRPFLARVRAPNGLQVTRNHPPVAGTDATDHDTMHPGIWLAFGDLGDGDFWRNKGRVEHVRFVEPPKASGPHGEFTVENRYLDGERVVCDETCRISIDARPDDTTIVWDSTFVAPHEFAFGDQEEMGLGVRVATPLAVKNGGTLTNSDGDLGEKQVWGKQADWCDYSGTIDSEQVGVLIVPDPKNFGRSWYHARDYGFVAANPFGRQAFTKGEASRIVVKPGDSLRLRYAVVLHAGQVDLNHLAAETLKLLSARR